MGVRAGKKLASGHYQANTIFGEVEKRLREMRKKTSPKPQPPKEEPVKKVKTNRRKK